MQQVSEPIVEDLVLVGGGHSHALALKQFGMNPLPGMRLTLLTEASNTPYSGMLPGHVAGFYSVEDCHIDLRPLAEFAGAQLYLDQAIALDLENRQVICAHRPPVGFDLLSIDIGSVPTLPELPGVADHSLPAKPIRRFLAHWQQLVAQVNEHPELPLRLAIVGGGTGGVELALAVQHHLHGLLQAAGQPRTNLEMHLFHRGDRVMPGHNTWVRDRLQTILSSRGIHLHLQETASGLYPLETQPGVLLQCQSGLAVACDFVIWVTQAAAPAWLRESGLATDARGFIQVDDTLRSLSHSFVFAAGDIATMVNHPRPKAGVFAVRQGKPLFQNLRRTLEGRPPRPYRPQSRFLSLIGTSNASAVASWGRFAWESPLMWRWKDRIDRRFMEQFRNLPAMSAAVDSTLKNPFPPSSQGQKSIPVVPAETKINSMRCGGCGAKVGSSILERVLQRLQQDQLLETEREDILIGLDNPDDAAVVRVPPEQRMVHTLDYFRTFLNDPFVFGQICANHSLSDLFAMGATPQSALAIATIPYGLETKVEETLYQLLAGAAKVLAQSQTALVGGHTTEGAELAFGLSCNGLVTPDRLLRKGGIQPGQVLILTKALGTGTLFAAQAQLKAKGVWIDQAIASMLLPNQGAAACFQQHQATACTDITGFGLLGHLVEMIRASQVAIDLDVSALPSLPGALELLERGITSSLHPQNLKAQNWIENLEAAQSHPLFPLLFDPQTAGGLLAAVPAAQAQACLTCLHNQGCAQSQIIGRAVPTVPRKQPVKFSNFE